MSFFTTPTGTFFSASYWPKANLAPLPIGSSSLNWWQDVDANALLTASRDTWAWVNGVSGTITGLSTSFYPLSGAFTALSNSYLVTSASYVVTSGAYVQTSAALSGFLNTSYPAFQSQMVALSQSYLLTSASYVSSSATFAAQINALSGATLAALSSTVYDTATGLSATMWGYTGSFGYKKGFYGLGNGSGTFYGVDLQGQRAVNAGDPVAGTDLVTLNYFTSSGINTAQNLLGILPSGSGPLTGAVKIGNNLQLATTDTICIFYSDNFTNPQLSIGADGNIRDLDGTGIILMGSASANPNVTLDNQIVRASGYLLAINNSGTRMATIDWTGKAFFSGVDVAFNKITRLLTGTTSGDAITYDQFSPVSSAFYQTSASFVSVSSSYVALSGVVNSHFFSGTSMVAQVYLKSPDGSAWKIEIDNSGILSSSKVS